MLSRLTAPTAAEEAGLGCLELTAAAPGFALSNLVSKILNTTQDVAGAETL